MTRRTCSRLTTSRVMCGAATAASSYDFLTGIFPCSVWFDAELAGVSPCCGGVGAAVRFGCSGASIVLWCGALCTRVSRAIVILSNRCLARFAGARGRSGKPARLLSDSRALTLRAGMQCTDGLIRQVSSLVQLRLELHCVGAPHS
jgi:hypothetical protein